MVDMRGVNTWQDELASLVENSGIQYTGEPIGIMAAPPPILASTRMMESETETESLKEQVTGFLKSWGEMLVDLGKGCKDIVTQSNLVSEDSFIVQKLGKPMAKASGRLKYLNEFLPEDRDPAIAWPVIFFVLLLALAGNRHSYRYTYISPSSYAACCFNLDLRMC
jgi:hypothetical protein